MSRRTLALCVLSIVCAGSFGFAQSPKVPPTKWTRQELQAIDRIAHAYYESQTRALLDMLSRLVSRINNVKIDALDQELANRNLPSVSRLLVESRLAYIQQGMGDKLPKPSPREALLILTALNQQVTKVLEAKAADDTLGGVAADVTVNGWTNRLWKLHVLENQLKTSRLAVDTMARLAKTYPAGLAIKLSDEEVDLIQRDYDQLRDVVVRSAREVEDREMEIRAARLTRSLQRLEDPALDPDRFLAAYLAEIDGQILSDYITRAASNKSGGVHNAVAAIGSTASVNAQIARARELADGLSYKAGLFFEGLHWWLRGRYGEGPDVGGLAKSPEALVSDAALFGIYMPTETPQPSDPSDARVKRATPRFDRRHHYWWTWEDRRLQRGKLSSSIISNEQEKFSVTMHAFW